jgi:Flp pilus assembly protein TadD
MMRGIVQNHQRSGHTAVQALRSSCSSLLVRCALVTLQVLLAGCHSSPWNRPAQVQTQAVPPITPQEAAPGTVSVDLTTAYQQNPFRATVTQDQRVHVHLDLGKVFEAQGNHEAALLEYQEALTASETRGMGKARAQEQALSHRRMAGALDRLGRFAQAEVHYKKALRLDPRNPRIWNDAGYSYYLQGRWADAERTLKTAARLAPEDQRIKKNLGLVVAAAGRPQEAFPLLSKYSGDAIGHANLGYLLAATGQVELARQQYLQALALRPNLVLAQRALAQLDHATVPEEIASAHTVDPQSPMASTVGPVKDSEVVKTSNERPKIPPPSTLFTTPPVPSRSLP